MSLGKLSGHWFHQVRVPGRRAPVVLDCRHEMALGTNVGFGIGCAGAHISNDTTLAMIAWFGLGFYGMKWD